MRTGIDCDLERPFSLYLDPLQEQDPGHESQSDLARALDGRLTRKPDLSGRGERPNDQEVVVILLFVAFALAA